mmetsp:Transcript_72268/g.83949  ORF Transcript_72268/g.83949 Transcript_72268/m.83949 type:complete len:381 (-) Transcript_72268:71-1213(-)
MSRRPENENPPEVYYNDVAARRYAQSSRIQNIQTRMTERAIELLQLPKNEPCHILDVGCGSGLSGHVLAMQGHSWVGMDISRSMLQIAKQRELEDSEDDSDEGEGDFTRRNPFGQLPLPGDSDNDDEDAESDSDEDGAPVATTSATQKFVEVIEADMGEGVPFRPGVFDGVISISAVQWLCYMDRKDHIPQKRLKALFQSLYNSLRRGARAVLQFYPEDARQMNMITQAAMKCGFGGGMVIDFPHSTKAKKFFLVLYAGQPGAGYRPPQPLTGEPEDYEDVNSQDETGSDDDGDDEDESGDEEYHGEAGEDEYEMVDGKRVKTCARARPHHRGAKRRRTDQRPTTGSKDWVLMKKAERRRRGQKTTEDSKYTLRKRKPRF